ncbi:MAG: hypothetical protein IBJ03_16710 [Gemmatimonadaceae bacterium]|nr:hypothetical protein [Gemmatimonadaceae bacterium]
MATISVGGGLTASDAGFSGQWSLTTAAIPLTRTMYRIAVTHGGAPIGLPVLIEVMRGRWALAVPGQTPTLIAANVLPLLFRFGVASEAPPSVTAVTNGLDGARTQFFPPGTPPGETRTAQQLATFTTLADALVALQSAISGSREAAALALAKARSAADAAFRVASAGDLAELDVIRLELESAGRLLGVSG